MFLQLTVFNLLGTLKTPYVALIDGITMGGVRKDRSYTGRSS